MKPRKRAFAYVRGLMAPLERRNGWTLAEQAGDGSPDGMQALLCSPCWDPDLVRDDVRDYVVTQGQLRGQIPADRSAGDLAAFLVTSLEGLQVMGAITPDRATLMRSAEVALRCLA